VGVRPMNARGFRIAIKGGLAQQMLAFKCDVAAHGFEKTAQHVSGRLDVDLVPASAQRVQGLGQFLCVLGHHCHHLGYCRLSGRRRRRLAACLAGSQHRTMVEFRALRPLHTSAVIFAFGGNALMATSFYVVQRTSRARLWGGDLAWFVFWGYQLFIVMAATGYLLGITQGREYAEPEWYVDLWLTIVWVAYLLVFLGTLMKRKEPHIYVANWFYLAFIVTIAMLHVVNNLAMPVSFLGSRATRPSAGVQDALTQWWYGHNAVGFFLTAGFLGMMYYFVPKQAGRPVYSYRLSIIHFWALIFLYIWAGPHHLHYTALPDWAQTLGMVFSIMLWMPSWGGMINGLMTLSGAWDKLRTDPILR
jgi:cytochrome c oxidase cbb3-type subunit 1